jgi:hypothetical protein
VSRAAALLPILPLLLALVVPTAGVAEARPEFARREAKACGYCHVNPRGGGPRNQTGILYARNEFSFPARSGDLRDFTRPKDRDAMVRVQKMLTVQHIPAAIKELSKMTKSVKGDAAKRAVESEIHSLDVKGWEMLGRVRLLMRKTDLEDVHEGIELLVIIEQEYKGLSVQEEAKKDLQELRREKNHWTVVKREKKEQKARRLLLDGLLEAEDGDGKKAQAIFEKVVKAHPETRAAKSAKKRLKDARGG